ncbi:hypothetical protein PV797_00080 [Clostridiaceae bacterium M8S5]|nr:hypothetical protein PV797_00080 [Clostridiaceae bacterium M8S5]
MKKNILSIGVIFLTILAICVIVYIQKQEDNIDIKDSSKEQITENTNENKEENSFIKKNGLILK